MTSIFIRFGKIIEAWSEKKYPPVMLSRIEVNTFDLSDEEMNVLCNLLLDHCEHRPTVAKVNEYASLVRNRRGRPMEEPEAYKHYCLVCFDLGVVKVKGVGIDSLMLCDCDSRDHGKEGPRNPWQLPRWSKSLEHELHREKCPVDWFTPNIDPSKTVLDSLVDRRDGWRERIKIAEQFWKAKGA